MIAPGRLLLRAIAPPACVACGAHPSRAEPICPRCRTELRWLDRRPVPAGGVSLWAPLAYDGPARALVAAVKYRSAERLADTMAAQIVAGAPATWLGGAVLVPVPLHPARRRLRGFNQAEAIAVAIAARTGMGVSDCLERRGPPTTQTGRGRAERAGTIAGAVTVARGALVPADVIMVDDVVTTGATLSACAAALRSAGVRRVRALAYARTPGR